MKIHIHNINKSIPNVHTPLFVYILVYIHTHKNTYKTHMCILMCVYSYM